MVLMLLSRLGMVANALLSNFCRTVLFFNSLLYEHFLVKLFHILSMFMALGCAIGYPFQYIMDNSKRLILIYFFGALLI